MKSFLWYIGVVLLISFSGPVYASANQTDTNNNDSTLISSPRNLISEIPDTSLEDSAKADTTLYFPLMKRSIASAVTNPVDFEKHLSQKPTVALFKSLLVPGWGQIGNRSYLKAALVIGLDSWFVSRAVHWGGEASIARRKWQAATTIQDKNRLYSDFSDKRSSRNKFIWFSGIVTFLSIFDAYVDAHLSGEPENRRNDAFQVSIMPEPDGGAMLAVRLSF